MAVQSTDPRNSGGDDDDLHREALRRADEVNRAEVDNDKKGREAQRFYVGEQWPDKDRQDREMENRPVIVINRQKAFVRQVTGDIRKDTPVPKFMPAKGGASQGVADVYNGLYRNIDQASNAKAAYVKAVENACQASIGWIRVNTEYSDDDGFDQDIRIRRIMDPFSVRADPSAQEPDKSDSRFMFVLDDIPREVFKDTYPDASADSFPSTAIGGMRWSTEDTIRVAEYWYRKPVKKTLYLMPDGSVSDKADGPAKPINEREVETTEIWQCILSGKEILRKAQVWAGKYIPLVPVVGEEVRLDGRTVRSGIVHDTIGPQQVLNYAVTAQVEAAGKAPKAPIAVTKGQIKGYEDDWAEGGSSNAAFLTYNADPLAPGPPQRIQPVTTQPGLSELVAQASQHLKDITGLHDASLGAQSNETSGRAILARQNEGDTGTFLYVDNLATALRQIGIILIDLFPKIYDAPRIVRILKEDGGHEMVQINQEFDTGKVDEMGQAIMKMHDLSVGEYDVVVGTGKSFATKRAEAADTTQSLIQAAPSLMAIAGDLFVKSLDIPYADEIAKRIERTMPPAILDDGPPQPPQPKPQEIADFSETMASAHLKSAQASKTLLEADTLATQMAAMPAQLQMLTQLVKSLVEGGGPPLGPQQAPPGAVPQMPPPGPPPGGMAELEPIGAPA